jgi:D-tyrosyl-tRNA(Tyr) deacylase
MRFVIQRVREARLDVDGRPYSAIGPGFVVLVGYGADEMLPENRRAAERSWEAMLHKMLGLRVFPDEAGKMTRDLDRFNGEILLVSQFTLYADCRKGKRPSFHTSAPAETAEAAYDKLAETLRERLPGRLKTGCFGADMDIHLSNWGPVTIILDSADF